MSMRWLIEEVDGIVDAPPTTPPAPDERPQATAGELNLTLIRRELRRWEQREARLRAD